MGKKRKAASPLQASPVSEAVTTATSVTGNIASAQDVRKLHDEITSLKQRVVQLELAQDAMEQRNRLVCLILSGPAIPDPDRHEDTLEIVKCLLFTFMSYSIDTDQVEAAFRLRSGSIMIKFKHASSGSDREKLYKTKAKLKGSGLFISESLTLKRQDVMRKLVQLRKSRYIHAAYTRSGELFVRKTSESAPHKIIDESAVQDLVDRAGRKK